MRKVGSVVLFVLLLFELGCRKIPESSRLLSGPIWREAKVVVKPNDNTNKSVRDITDHFPDTDQDDVLIFYRNGKYKWDEGISKASSSNRQIYQSGTWSLEPATHRLTLTAEASITIYEVISISENQLVLRLPFKEDPTNFHFELIYQAER